jgi:guanylate kinase
MIKDKIICLVGESGSGKTTVAKALEDAGYNVIHSYTTRPQRQIDEWGHRFVDESALKAHMEMSDQIIAYKLYDGYHYWAIRLQYKDLGTSIYVIDPDGLEMLFERVSDAELIPVYLKADKEERIIRMKEQGRSIADVARCIDYDRNAFRTIRCSWVVDANKSTEDTILAVMEIISKVSGE